MGEGVRAAFGLAGGLALFLFGMENMSRALQQAAGERMRGFLRRITRTPLTGALAGLLVTAVLQSSSATTVMVIGFVSAGLMELPQAVAVVFGANVGTTMTAQLVAFRLADWVFPILFAGVLVWLLARRERTRQLGLAVFSFGLLFDGIEVLSGAMTPLAEHPVFLRWMTQVRHTPLLGLLLGTGMTLVVQSSSATIAVLQRAAQQAGPDGIHSVLGLAGALPILLGDNIGTTITAVLAAVVLTLLPELLRDLADYRMLIYSVVLVLMMILRPQGLLGKREFSLSRLWERLTAMLKKPVPAGGKGEE